MSSEISTAERAAINAAIEAGKVQRIPQGQSTFVYPVWKPDANALVVPDGVVSWKRQNKNGYNVKNLRPSQPCPLVTARREKVAEMVLAGLSSKAISEALGVNRETIWSDATKMGVKFAPIQRKKIEDNDKPAKALAMREAGMSSTEIASNMGLAQNTVNRYIRTARAKVTA